MAMMMTVIIYKGLHRIQKQQDQCQRCAYTTDTLAEQVSRAKPTLTSHNLQGNQHYNNAVHSQTSKLRSTEEFKSATTDTICAHHNVVICLLVQLGASLCISKLTNS